MGSFTTTTAAAFIAEIWQPKILYARQDVPVVRKRIMVVEKDVQFGDIVHFPNIANIAAASVSADGTVTNTANTETDTTVTVNQWRSTGVDIPNNVLRQSGRYQLADRYAPKLAEGVEVDIEAQLLDLYDDSGITTSGGGTVGTSGAGIADEEVISALSTLDGNNVPFQDRSFLFLNTSQRDLRRLDKFVSAAESGNPGSVNGRIGQARAPGIQERFMGNLYGVPAWWGTTTTTMNANQNILTHAEAVALALQKDVSVAQLPVSRLAMNVVADAMFGVGITRGSHAVLILS